MLHVCIKMLIVQTGEVVERTEVVESLTNLTSFLYTFSSLILICDLFDSLIDLQYIPNAFGVYFILV